MTFVLGMLVIGLTLILGAVIVHLWTELTDLRRECKQLRARISELGGQVQGLRRVRVGLSERPEPATYDPFDKFWQP